MNTEKLEKELEVKFPIGSKFIYNSEYGGKLELIVSGFFICWNISNGFNNPIPDISIRDEKNGHCYEIENCEPLK